MRNNRISLKSTEWQREDDYRSVNLLQARGFGFADEVMKIRVYDLLNICSINAIEAGEIVQMLYRLYNPNLVLDKELEPRFIKHKFLFSKSEDLEKPAAEWKVRDLVMIKGIYSEALYDYWDWICKCFWKSDEYNWREYRYWNYHHLRHERGRGNEQK